MKLQIINRLSISTKENSDTVATVRRQSQQINNQRYTQYINNHFSHNYYSIDSHGNTNYTQICYPDKNSDNARQFYNNFDVICSVKYEQTKKGQPRHRRKLENQLKALMINNKDFTPKSNELVHKLLTIQDNICIKQKIKKISSPLQHRNYYLGQNKVKDKIRKISSLASIRTEQSTDLNRKPGFILKKNNSFIKRQSTQQFTLIEDSYPNKQNINPNIVATQPDSCKQSGSNVDRQIWQSKQRIARIRQELNEIYEMRREPARFKLKLF